MPAVATGTEPDAVLRAAHEVAYRFPPRFDGFTAAAEVSDGRLGMRHPPSSTEALGMSAAIAARGVSFEREGARLVDDMSLSVSAGELVAIVGPNGSGKSTLLALRAGGLRPAAGTVLQFAFTARDVVELGRSPYARHPGRLADDVAADQTMASTQTGSLAGRRYLTLSGGEAARVRLARVLAQDTDVLLLDEPTASLDLAHQEAVMAVAVGPRRGLPDTAVGRGPHCLPAGRAPARGYRRRECRLSDDGARWLAGWVATVAHTLPFSTPSPGAISAPASRRSRAQLVVERVRRGGVVVLGALLVATAFGLAAAHPAAADPREDLAGAGSIIGRAREAARAGDLVAVRREYSSYENRWFDIEDGIRADAADTYRTIERAMSDVRRALAEPSPTAEAVGAALDSLTAEQQRFIASRPQPSAAPASRGATPASSASGPALLGLVVVPFGIVAALAARRRRHRRTPTTPTAPPAVAAGRPKETPNT